MCITQVQTDMRAQIHPHSHIHTCVRARLGLRAHYTPVSRDDTGCILASSAAFLISTPPPSPSPSLPPPLRPRILHHLLLSSSSSSRISSFWSIIASEWLVLISNDDVGTSALPDYYHRTKRHRYQPLRLQSVTPGLRQQQPQHHQQSLMMLLAEKQRCSGLVITGQREAGWGRLREGRPTPLRQKCAAMATKLHRMTRVQSRHEKHVSSWTRCNVLDELHGPRIRRPQSAFVS